MVNEQYDRAKEILSEYKEKHKELAELLRSKEVIFAEDVEHIFGKRKWKSRSLEIIMDDKRQDTGKTIEQKEEKEENKDIQPKKDQEGAEQKEEQNQ